MNAAPLNNIEIVIIQGNPLHLFNLLFEHVSDKVVQNPAKVLWCTVTGMFLYGQSPCIKQNFGSRILDLDFINIHIQHMQPI